jgi:hypothetical protein
MAIHTDIAHPTIEALAVKTGMTGAFESKGRSCRTNSLNLRYEEDDE